MEAKDPFSPPYVPELFVAEDTVKEEEDDEEGEAFVILVRLMGAQRVLRGENGVLMAFRSSTSSASSRDTSCERSCQPEAERQLPKLFVVPRLVTKEFAPQTLPLTPLELVATFSILKQLGQRQKHIAFFNCGPQSGAS